VSNLLVEAYLTPRQRQVARLILWGWEPKEIAAKLGIAASTVRKLWSRARKPLGEALVKLALARAQEEEDPIPTAELREIYLGEAGRYGYQQPRHCPASKERCRKTGVCEFALYSAHLVAGAQRDE
jgi:transcriptional regulator with XRE-family HTH domain